MPGLTETEWEKNIDYWIDARNSSMLVAESLTNPLGGAGNTIGGKFNWHEFFTILKTVTNCNFPITHKSKEEVGEYSAELFGQTYHYSNEKVNKYYNFKPKFNLKETLQEIFSL